MEVKVDVRLNGLEEALGQLGPKLAKKAVRKALKAGAKVMEDEIKAQVPVDTGSLRDAIGTTIKLQSKKDRGIARVGPIWDKETLKKGSDHDQSQDPAVYAYIVEFGNKRQSANPFMRNSFDSKKEAAADAIIEQLRTSLADVLKGR